MKKLLLIIGIMILITGCSKGTGISIVNKTLPIYSECINNMEELDKTLNNSHEVNLYLFYSPSCGHCHNELTWLDSIKDKYPSLHIYKYDVFDNTDLYDYVNKEMNINTDYVPLTIIGSNYKIGFSDSTKESLTTIIEEYSKTGYEDKITEIIKNK